MNTYEMVRYEELKDSLEKAGLTVSFGHETIIVCLSNGTYKNSVIPSIDSDTLMFKSFDSLREFIHFSEYFLQLLDKESKAFEVIQYLRNKQK